VTLTDRPPTDVELIELITWYAREAAVLDERRFDEWLAMLTDDIRYQVPVRRNRAPADAADFANWTVDAELAGPDGLYFIDNDIRGLHQRIDRLRTGTAWAERPPSRVTRLVGLPLLTAVMENAASVRTTFILRRTRVDSEASTLSGFRRDVLRRVAGTFQLAHRVVVLDAVVLPSHNLSVLL
jgi:3-phenylpropionate/cinnamic acid dioxygenase small subunit